MAGFFNAGLGLGETGRLIAHSIEAAGVPLVTRSWQNQDTANAPLKSPSGPVSKAGVIPQRPGGISLLSMNGDHLASFRENGGAAFFDNRYCISIWFWEMPQMQARLAAGFKYVDEVWTASPFVRDILESHSGGVPVRLFSQPMIPPRGNRATAMEQFPFGGRFVFLFCFNYQSAVMRKNPHGTCEAFARAFPELRESGPLCVIKSMNSGLFPVDHALLRQAWAHRPDIVFMDDFLNSEDRDLLVWRADACVSLHRSEGLGLTLLEGMAAGKPCIATGYSGNLTFMSPENSWLVPWQETCVGPGSLHFEPHHTWADPDLDVAAAAMREVVAGGPNVEARAAAGREFVRLHHDPLRCGQQMAQMLRKADSRPIRPKEFPSSARAMAFQMLAELRNLEKKIPTDVPGLFQTPEAMETLSRELPRLSRTLVRVLSQTLRATRQIQQFQQDELEVTQRHLDRLTQQLAEVVHRLPPA